MRTHHGDRVAGLPSLAYAEGDDRGAIAGQVVPSTRLQRRGPGLTLLDLPEAGLG
jgi:hypothetical protein